MQQGSFILVLRKSRHWVKNKLVSLCNNIRKSIERLCLKLKMEVWCEIQIKDYDWCLIRCLIKVCLLFKKNYYSTKLPYFPTD